MAAAVLSGTKSLVAIGEWITDAQPWALRTLGYTPDPFTGQTSAPHPATIRRLLERLDGDALDRAVGAFLDTRFTSCTSGNRSSTTDHIWKTRESRGSEPLCDRLQNRHALNVRSHREHVRLQTIKEAQVRQVLTRCTGAVPGLERQISVTDVCRTAPESEGQHHDSEAAQGNDLSDECKPDFPLTDLGLHSVSSSSITLTGYMG
ncbi:transposase family protein [Streptomyces sp. NPDC006175]|uniref:transposase family protein n=1 Tax=Streptomyces sp. NPDC006175 TaxID=3154471 RepID=UPI00339E2A7D